jgi:hypothetical protein
LVDVAAHRGLVARLRAHRSRLADWPFASKPPADTNRREADWRWVVRDQSTLCSRDLVRQLIG